MSNKRLFLIVDDENPADQAARLQQSLKLAGLAGDVGYVRSPAELFEFVRKTIPSVILLDHHWPEVTIDRVLDELRRTTPTARVVLYTGKQSQPSTIIACARYGVAEYLMKGSVTDDALAKNLSMLAHGSENTIERLSVTSRAVQQLIQEAEKAVAELDGERGARRRLEAENISLKSKERHEIYGNVVRFVLVVLYVCVVAAVLFFVNRSSGGGGWVMSLCGVVAVCGMFLLDKSLSRLVLKIGGHSVRVTRED